MSEYLVIDDDVDTGNLILRALDCDEFRGQAVVSGEEALRLLTEKTFLFTVMDMVMPGVSGIELYHRLRLKNPEMPIVILSSLDTVEDRVRGLHAGCDEYITKPFSSHELRLRVGNILRTLKKQKAATTLAFDNLHICRLSRTATQGGRILQLARMEFLLLELFVANAEKIVSKEQILRDVFNIQFSPGTNVVDVLVCRLRGKLDSERPCCTIRTMRRQGYVLRGQGPFMETSRSAFLAAPAPT